MDRQNDNSARGVEMKPILCAKCGLPMSKNPHPQAGKPPDYLEVGTMYECIPCLVGNRHRWAERAMKAESALDADAADLWRVTNAIKKEIGAREWIMEGRGCYAWDDARYKDETRLVFEAVFKLIAEVQHPAQLRFHQVMKGSPTTPPPSEAIKP